MSTLKNPIIQYIKDVIQFSIDENTSVTTAFNNHKWITYDNSSLEYKIPDHYSIYAGENEALYFITPAGIQAYNLIDQYNLTNLAYDVPLNYEMQCSSIGDYTKIDLLSKTYNTGTINNSFSKNTSLFFNLIQEKFFQYPDVGEGQIYNLGLAEFGTIDKDSCVKEIVEYLLTVPSLNNDIGVLQEIIIAFMDTGFASYTNNGSTVYAGTGQGFLNWW